MPIYEYECKSCGKRFEHLQDMNDAAPCCPQCKGTVKKLMSAATPLSSGHGGSAHGCRGMEEGCGGSPRAGGTCGGGKCCGM